MPQQDVVTQDTQRQLPTPPISPSAIRRCRRAISPAVSGRVTEADALIAYLQMLGTQVDFKLYDDKANIR